MSERCPHCSFNPTTYDDFCDKHRPKPFKAKEELDVDLAEVFAKMLQEAILTERERCAKIIEDYYKFYEGSSANHDSGAIVFVTTSTLAKAIRGDK